MTVCCTNGQIFFNIVSFVNSYDHNPEDKIAKIIEDLDSVSA